MFKRAVQANTTLFRPQYLKHDTHITTIHKHKTQNTIQERQHYHHKANNNTQYNNKNTTQNKPHYNTNTTHKQTRYNQRQH